jgi:hypothetical protein
VGRDEAGLLVRVAETGLTFKLWHALGLISIEL